MEARCLRTGIDLNASNALMHDQHPALSQHGPGIHFSARQAYMAYTIRNP